jgi:hypothetical protein
VDLNGDANITDYVPGTTRNVFNRGSNEALMAAVNAYRATRGLLALPVSQIDTNEVYVLDMRVSKSIRISNDRRVELVAQVFNLLNRKNLLAGGWVTNARSNTFGSSVSAGPMRQAELGVRFSF